MAINDKTKELYSQLDKYSFMDIRWQNNYVRRCRRVANKIDTDNPGELKVSMMRLDIIHNRIGRNIF